MSHTQPPADVLASGERPTPPRLVYSVQDVVEATGLSRSTIYEELSSGRLRSVKRGRRRLIRPDALLDWLAGLSDDADQRTTK